MNKSYTSFEQVMSKSWTSPKQAMNNSWTSHKVANKLWTSYEQEINEEVQTAKLPCASHEQVVYKSILISPEQVINK